MIPKIGIFEMNLNWKVWNLRFEKLISKILDSPIIILIFYFLMNNNLNEI